MLVAPVPLEVMMTSYVRDRPVRALTYDVSDAGIGVSAICPGVVETGMWDIIDRGYQEQGLTEEPGEAFRTLAARAVLGRPSQPADLVGVAAFLASAGSDFMTGQSLVVDGGIVMQ